MFFHDGIPIFSTSYAASYDILGASGAQSNFFTGSLKMGYAGSESALHGSAKQQDEYTKPKLAWKIQVARTQMSAQISEIAFCICYAHVKHSIIAFEVYSEYFLAAPLPLQHTFIYTVTAVALAKGRMNGGNNEKTTK